MDDHIRNGVGALRPYLHGTGGPAPTGGGRTGSAGSSGTSWGRRASMWSSKSATLPWLSKPENSGRTRNPGRTRLRLRAGHGRGVLEGRELRIASPADKPHQERQAGLRDAAGNTWWIATYWPDVDGAARVDRNATVGSRRPQPGAQSSPADSASGS